MSEVIEEYIRRHGGASEDAAFERFVQIDRIKTWVGSDASRRDRLRREFGRVWESMHASTDTQQSQQLVRPAAPAPQAARPAPPPAPPAATPPAPRLETGPARRLSVLCNSCERMDVWLQDGDIACRACGRDYDDMLQLIPVKTVGPFEYAFGEGAAGWLTAGGVAAGLSLLYVAFRWLG